MNTTCAMDRRWLGFAQTLAILAALAVLAGNAHSSPLCESFPDPLGGWKTRWLGQNSNMTNYYICSDSTTDENFRGNNCCGLWICDSDQDFNTAIINFNPTFGATVTNFTLDIVAFVPETFTIYHLDGSTAYTQNVPAGGAFPPCDNNIYGSACNGISKFTIVGSGRVEGNTSITNVCATSASPAPAKAPSAVPTTKK